MEVTELSDLLDPRNIKTERSCNFDDPESEDLIIHFNNDNALGMMSTSSEMLTPLAGFEEADDDTVQSAESSEEIIVHLMDIRTRLSTLRTMLERRLDTDLSQYTFWLQDAKELESHKTLVDQCIKGEGVVQVNIQVKTQERKINIVDVLKPDEELMDFAPTIEIKGGEDMEEGEVAEVETEEVDCSEILLEPETVVSEYEEARDRDQPLHSTMVKWVVDEQLQSDRSRLKMPDDPSEWTVYQVKVWIQWAVRQFNLKGVKLSDWNMSGQELCEMTLPEFRLKCPSDPGDMFWTHLELLRKCKFMAVVEKPQESVKMVPEDADCLEEPRTEEVTRVTASGGMKREAERDKQLLKKRKTQSAHAIILDDGSYGYTSAKGSHGGQIHLWQFLLELLTTAEHLPVIQWVGTEGEFKLVEPEQVARLWGVRKHKPAMNYEKLSRALRYYYDGDMIAKVSGKRFVYKFVCDLSQLVGYTAAELSQLVTETYNQLYGNASE